MFLRFCFLLVIVFLSVISSSANGEWGIKSGITYSMITEGESKWDSGYNLGLFKDIYLTKSAVLSFEFNYTERKAVLRDIVVMPVGGWVGDIHSNDYYLSHGYLEVPFFLKVALPLNEKVTLKPYVGVSRSLAIMHTKTKNQKIIISNYTGNPLDLQYADIIAVVDAPSEWDSGVYMGGTIQYLNYIGDFRYYHGKDDVSFSGTTPIHHYKWRSFNISIGYAF